jgi:hypothetical protein
MIAYIKALDPAFRTTGHYYDHVANLHDFLATFADNMTLCLQWTRDFTLQDDVAGDAQGGWPVGAVDICSGSSVVDPGWNDGVLTYRDTQGGSIEPGWIRVSNIDESVTRAAGVRERKWQALYEASGIPTLRQLIDHLRTLKKVPDTSETVQFFVTRFANRVEAGKGSQHVPATGVCAGRDFPATIYQVARTISITVHKQPEVYTALYPAIPYKFFLESYASTANPLDWTSAIERIPIPLGAGSINIKAELFDWIVEAVPFIQGPRSHPSELKQLVSMFAGGLTGTPSVRRYPGLDPAVAIFSDANKYGTSPDEPGIAQNYRNGTITIEYQLELSDGKAVCRLQNHPDQGSFQGVYFVVEETPGSQAEWGGAPVFGGKQVLRSNVDVSMTGLEYHVGSDYFKYRKDCVGKAVALLGRIYKLSQVNNIPVPKWDPWQYENVGAYLKAIREVSPRLLDESQK